ncbi:MAG: signal peptidase I [Oscillospiraceae bacterium]|nr:signal peptidase I [Oscillospiraceae bacterium]
MSTTQTTPSEVLRERGRALVRRGSWRRLALSAGAALAGTLLLFGLLFGVAAVHGDSMNPAFRGGDLVLFSRLGRNYRPGDVVILKAEVAQRTGGTSIRKYLKRVVAVPGDAVDIGALGVFVNGAPLEQPYAQGRTERGQSVAFPLLLGEGEYFVLGDNRESSDDSRSFGPITAAHIEGKVLAALRTGRP